MGTEPILVVSLYEGNETDATLWHAWPHLAPDRLAFAVGALRSVADQLEAGEWDHQSMGPQPEHAAMAADPAERRLAPRLYEAWRALQAEACPEWMALTVQERTAWYAVSREAYRHVGELWDPPGEPVAPTSSSAVQQTDPQPGSTAAAGAPAYTGTLAFDFGDGEPWRFVLVEVGDGTPLRLILRRDGWRVTLRAEYLSGGVGAPPGGPSYVASE